MRIAVIGAGGFAGGVHLPNLRRLADLYSLEAVVTRSGARALAATKEFGARYATTDINQVLADPLVDAVLIATRHNLHASLAAQAIRAGKHVLVEKPLALTRDELALIKALYADRQPPAGPLLLTGFNRRFSPDVRRIREFVAGRRGAMVATYRMNAGPLPPDHWVFTAEGGGRNLGEACHIYDLFTYLMDSRVVAIAAQAAPPRGAHSSDNFAATMRFLDGSVATLTYTSLGSPEYPKERCEVFVDGAVIILDDFKRLMSTVGVVPTVERRHPDKGLEEELRVFARAVQAGGDWPSPLWQQIQATEIALQVEDLIMEGT